MAIVEVVGATPTPKEWEEISRRLRDPFKSTDVDFRVLSRGSGAKSQVAAYIDARAAQDRLDAVVGAGNWSFDWQATVVEGGEVRIAKGTLTIYGVSISDVGEASKSSPSKGAVSDALKRAAVQFGIARYIYNLPVAYAATDNNGRILPAVLAVLREQLPHPGTTPEVAPIEQRWSEEDRSVESQAEQPVAAQATQATAQQAVDPKPAQQDAKPAQKTATAASATTLAKGEMTERSKKRITEIRAA